MIVQPEQKPKTKKIILISILAIVCAFCIFAYFNQGKFLSLRFLFTGSTNTNAKSIMKINYDINKKPTFETYNNKVLSITKEGIQAINMSNKVEWEIKLDLANPVVKTEDKYLLVADMGGKGLSLYQDNKKLWSKNVDGKITNIKLNKSGYVLVFNQKDIGKQITGFNNKGTKILEKDYKNQGFLVNADISSDNKKIAALSIFTEKSRVASKVDIFEIKSSADVNSVPVSGISKEDVLASDIKLFDNGNIVMTADNRIIALDASGNDKWVKNFEGGKIFKADISSGNYVILETNGPLSNSFFQSKTRQIQVINSDGVIAGEGVKITSPVTDIETYKNYFIVNDSSNLYSIAKGKLIWSCPIGKDIKYARGFEGKSQILLITRDYIEVIGII